MTNRLELNWKLDGFVDEQRYYCSETPIDPLNLPAPKDVLAGDVRSYVDAAIDVGKTYYVAVGSVKNGVEKLSDIASVTTINDVNWSNVATLLHFNDNLYDEKNEVLWTSASPVFVSGKWGKAASFNANNSNVIKSTNFASINLGSSDFRIQLQLKLNRKSGASEWMGVFGKQDADATRSYALLVNNSSSKLVFIFKSAETGVVHVLNSSVELPLNAFVYVEISRVGNNIYMILEDDIVGTLTLPTGTSAYSNTYGLVLGRIYYNASSFPLDGSIDEFRITKGEGVDINNLTIPTAEFKNY